MIARTRISKTLGEFKHMPAVDMDQLKTLMGRVSDMVCELPDLLEADINPLLIDDRKTPWCWTRASSCAKPAIRAAIAIWPSCPTRRTWWST